MDAVIAVDLGTHMIAFITLLFGIQIPKRSHTAAKQLVPIMNANLNVILRTSIPVEMQGSVYSCRNTLKFFTIPVGFFLGSFLVDVVFEPLMAKTSSRLLTRLFGTGTDAGAAVVMLSIGIAGVTVCLCFRHLLKKYKFRE